jgi:NTP pyrophosphatase (non-canonical NTP hydrolase)
MTFEEYQELAMRTANLDKAGMSNVALGLCGEAGEVADIVKKWMFQGHPLDYAKLREELGDVMWYLALACELMDVGLVDIAAMNITKLKARYPNGFSAEASVNRQV